MTPQHKKGATTMTTTTDQIRDLGGRWVHAEIAADVDTLESLVTDDFRVVGPFGFVLDKEQWLDRYRSGDYSTAALLWHDVDVREYGNAAVAIGTYSQKAAFQGSPANADFRSTHIFVHDGGRWMIAGMQLSPTTFVSPQGADAGA
jgi:ketosteroid isomerase-like protein